MTCEIMRALTLLLFTILITPAHAYHNSAQKVNERTKPVGQVKIVDVAAAAAAAEPRTGDAVYNGACMACHTTGAAGAPKFGDKAAWDARGKTVEAYTQSVWNGLGAMPAKGMCMDCSQDEIRAAVEHILASVQ